MSSLLRFIDRLTERGVRQVAHRHGRRSLLTRLGVLIAGSTLLGNGTIGRIAVNTTIAPAATPIQR